MNPPEWTWPEIDARLNDAPYYRLICDRYQGKFAKRSGLPYINHIHEGVFVYARLYGWEESSVAAFCVHPLFQSDRSLQKILSGEIDISILDRDVIVLAMEYRRVANAYLSTVPVRSPENIGLSPLDAVNRLLVVDKVQNKKDFMVHLHNRYNRRTYRRASERYVAYFDSWLARLNVAPEGYELLASELAAAFAGRAPEAVDNAPR